MSETDAEKELASDLCSECGMCCDGTLFHAVRLHAGDSPRELAGLGLKLQYKKRQYSILQPCPAFCGTHCEIYQHRPTRCRAFNCRQLVLLAGGKTTESAVRERIREARQRANEVTGLLEAAGEHNRKRDLALRYEFASARPLDPAHEPEALAVRERLTAAMRGLEEILQRDFRTAKEEA